MHEESILMNYTDTEKFSLYCEVFEEDLSYISSQKIFGSK
jgi:hypothetical protein